MSAIREAGYPGRVTVEWLAGLERALAEDPNGDELATALVVLASVAGSEIAVDEAERHGATRRALLLLTAGGDPARGLDLNGRAVTALAADLEEPARQAELSAGLERLLPEATGLPHISEVVRALTSEPDIAWRAYACSLLAESLGDG